MIKNCINDGTEFDAARSTARFCSEKCKKAYARKGTARVAKAGIDLGIEIQKEASKKIIAEAEPLIKQRRTKAERIKIMNERLAARGLPLLSDKIEPVLFIPTGIEALDALTADADEQHVGGFPRKHITEVFGPKGTGKTSLMKLIAQNTQGLEVLYVDAENGLLNPPDWVEVSKASTVEAVEGMVFEGIVAGIYDLIIIDSVAALTSTKEMEESKTGMGAKPKAMAQFLRRVNAALRPLGPDGYPDPSQGTALVFINQLRDTMASFGVQEYTPGGRSIEYAASLRLELRSAKADRIVKADVTVGQKVRVKVEKSRFGAPGQTTTYKMMYEDLV